MPYKDINSKRRCGRKWAAKHRAMFRTEYIEYKRLLRLSGIEKPDRNSKLRAKKWRLANPDRVYEAKRKWYLANIELVRKRSRENKKTESRKQSIRRYEKERIKSDPGYAILSALRRRFSHALKGRLKCANTKQLLGCSIENFKIYLESKFEPGMSWENYGRWHIDHIMPCSIFDLTKLDHQKRCFHFSNMQPMWAVDNFRKGKRVLDNQFRLL